MRLQVSKACFRKKSLSGGERVSRQVSPRRDYGYPSTTLGGRYVTRVTYMVALPRRKALALADDVCVQERVASENVAIDVIDACIRHEQGVTHIALEVPDVPVPLRPVIDGGTRLSREELCALYTGCCRSVAAIVHVDWAVT